MQRAVENVETFVVGHLWPPCQVPMKLNLV